MELIATEGPYALHFLPGESQSLILACASIGHDPTRAPVPEWARSTRPHPTLFLTDAARSWGTAPGLAEILAQAPAFPRTLALGASMGAFLALQATHHLPIDAVIAMGPQHRPAAAWETRWRAHTASLPETLTAPPSRARQTYVLHAADDHLQAQGFTQSQGCDCILFPDQAHSTLAAQLKPALPGLIQAALTDRRRFLRLVSQAGGIRQPRFFAEKSSPSATRPPCISPHIP